MKNFSGIHPTAIMGDGVKIGDDVVVGPHVIVYDNVTIGDGCRIGADAILGEPLAGIYRDAANYVNPPLTIGAGSVIRSGSIIYAGSTLGRGLETGHRVTIREGTVAGENFRVGTLSDIQGDCVIGDYVRLHSNVHVGMKSVIGDYVWIFPYVVLTNDPHPPSNFLVGVTIEDFAVIATMSVILPGVTIGKDALVGAGAIVNRDVAAEDVVVGNPAKRVATVRDIKSKGSPSPVYPWRETFERGMPWEGVGYDSWKSARDE
jgi:acetyltransferase-like isoleucine patch superfamily enzyme